MRDGGTARAAVEARVGSMTRHDGETQHGPAPTLGARPASSDSKISPDTPLPREAEGRR